MSLNFQAIIAKHSDPFPAKMKRFIAPTKQSSGLELSWSYYAFAYERAFEILVEEYAKRHPNQIYLHIPLMQTARHSMELALKTALHECNHFTPESLKITGHNLLVLYDRLDDFLIGQGMIELGDPWTKYSRNLLVHIDKFDPNGEVFRFPVDIVGFPFNALDIDIEGLIIAHHHITTLADATVTMLQDVGDYPYEFE